MNMYNCISLYTNGARGISGRFGGQRALCSAWKMNLPPNSLSRGGFPAA